MVCIQTIQAATESGAQNRAGCRIVKGIFAFLDAQSAVGAFTTVAGLEPKWPATPSVFHWSFHLLIRNFHAQSRRSGELKGRNTFFAFFGAIIGEF